jgi:DNA-binding transcriptional ArsR family regulator
MTQPAISKHLKVLERAGLISRGQDAQRRPRRLEPKPFAEATEWLEKYRRLWAANFQRLDALLEQMKLDQLKPKEKRRGRKKTKGDHR